MMIPQNIATQAGEEKSKRASLTKEYLEKIGYDPFEDDPTITIEEVEQILWEWDKENDASQ